MFEVLDLIFDAYGLSLEDDYLVVLIFSENLGAIRIRLPLDNLSDYFGAISNALKETDEDNQ